MFLWSLLRYLYSLVPLAVFSLLSHLHCNGHNLLLNCLELAELRILYVAPAVIRPRTLPISLCNVQVRSLCAARSLVTPFRGCIARGEKHSAGNTDNCAAGSTRGFANNYEDFAAKTTIKHRLLTDTACFTIDHLSHYSSRTSVHHKAERNRSMTTTMSSL